MLAGLEELVNALCKLPTIGRKSAWRLALYLMERPASESEFLAGQIVTVRKKIRHCNICRNYSEYDVCDICASPSRDKSVICVVEKPTDVFAIENAGRYRGVYHVLGGLLSPLSGVTAEKLQVAPLLSRVREGGGGGSKR